MRSNVVNQFNSTCLRHKAVFHLVYKAIDSNHTPSQFAQVMCGCQYL